MAQANDMSLTAGSLTAQALAAGLVDEFSVTLVPVDHLCYRCASPDAGHVVARTSARRSADTR